MNESRQASSNVAEELPPGLMLGPYRIKEVLGQGGFGVTYLAEKEPEGDMVVIKESLPAQFAARNSATHTISARRGEESAYAWATQRFLEEANLLATLDHPHIVKVLHAFQALGTAYYVMPWVGGQSLDTAPLCQDPEQRQTAAQNLLNAMLDTLSYLHGKNLLHRDIKPANILQTTDGTPVLIDFGTARANIGQKSHTRIESPGYTPFEQMMQHGNVGPWSDIYALSATMIKLLTGETPEPATDRQRKDAFTPLAKRADLCKIYPPALLRSIDKGFAVAEEKRWQSVAEWQAYLQRHQAKSRKGLFRGLGISAAVLTATAAGIYGCVLFTDTPRGTTEIPAEETPLQALERRAAANDTEALYQLAQQYFKGSQGVEKNPEKAVTYLRRAAELGYAKAQNNLAWRHCKNYRGVSRNPDEAVKWFTKAAEQGYANAQTYLGILYWEGAWKGYPKNAARAADWFLKAAKQGDVMAQACLGDIYRKGEGEPQNDTKAAEWFEQAAKADIRPTDCEDEEEADRAERDNHAIKCAQYDLGLMYQTGKGVDKNLAEARRLYTKAAEQGHTIAQRNLGFMYLKGEGGAGSAEKAAECFQSAAKNNDVVAIKMLGDMYRTGKGVPQSNKEAEQRYTQIADAGPYHGAPDEPAAEAKASAKLYDHCIKDAQYQLGRLAEARKDTTEARRWYTQAANQGYARAQRNLGRMYAELDEMKDDKEADKWLNRAAAQEDRPAQCAMGNLNRIGSCFSPSDKEAVKWYTLAAEAGPYRPDIDGVVDEEEKELYQNSICRAQLWLGIMYLGGKGVEEQSETTAFHWFEKAAKLDYDGTALYFLGNRYEKGSGVTSNISKAKELYKKAADKGNEDAKRALQRLGQ